MATYKVRINRKMAEEWRDRDLGAEGMPITAGMHELTKAQLDGISAMLKDDLDNYLHGFGDATGWRDMAEATKRQIANINKALEKRIGKDSK